MDLRKYAAEGVLDSSVSEQGQVLGLYEQGIEIFGYLKWRSYFDNMSDFYVHNKDSVPWLVVLITLEYLLFV